VTKLSADGTNLLFSTFLGGTDGDNANAIALDASGAIVVTGTTYSNDFPTTPGAYDTMFNGETDVFVTKLSADGSNLIFGTYLGSADRDFGRDMGVDASGAIVVAGHTESSSFPTTIGAFDPSFNGILYFGDAFVTKLSADGSSLIYGTYLGGASDEWIEAIAVNGAGDAVVTGWTNSRDFPTTPGAFDTTYNGGGVHGGSDDKDVFAAKLSSDGSQLIYCTYLGGERDEWSYDVILDSAGAALITGWTRSDNFPVSPGAYDTSHNGDSEDIDVFMSKLSLDGSKLLYGTFLGGAGADWGISIALDSAGDVVLGGFTASAKFPLTYGAYPQYRPTYDLFLTKIPLDLYELSSDSATISESTGGVANLTLNAHQVNANRNYYVLGSLSGTTPGILLPVNQGNVLFLN